jgi:hypothetical protein
VDNLNVVGIGADGESSRRGSSLIVVAHVGEIAHWALLDSDIVRGSHEEREMGQWQRALGGLTPFISPPTWTLYRNIPILNSMNSSFSVRILPCKTRGRFHPARVSVRDFKFSPLTGRFQVGGQTPQDSTNKE